MRGDKREDLCTFRIDGKKPVLRFWIARWIMGRATVGAYKILKSVKVEQKRVFVPQRPEAQPFTNHRIDGIFFYFLIAA